MSSKKITKDINFAKRLKILIECELEITQAEFAKKVGVTQGYLNMVLGTKNKPPSRGPSAELIAGIFIHYSNFLHWLLTGEAPHQIIEKHVNLAEEEKDTAAKTQKNYADILRMTAEIMESQSVYADALKSNVVAFHRAVTREALPAMESAMELRIKEIIEKELRLIKGTGGPPGERISDSSRKDGAASDSTPEGPELGKMGM